MTQAINKRPNADPSQLALTVDELKKRYLFGVDLTNDEGYDFPEEMFTNQILSAQAWLETEIPGLSLFPLTIADEGHDYYMNDYSAYAFIKLFRYPLQSVEKVAIQFPLSSNVLEFDEEWYRADSVGGQIQLVPTQGTFSSIILSQGGSFLPLLYSGLANVPYLWKISYTAGFESGYIPAHIIDLIGLKAAIQPLNIAGDLIAGAGIASKSIGIDGLSQGITTTASAENTGYSAKIKQMEKEIASKLKHLKESYAGIQMVVM